MARVLGLRAGAIYVVYRWTDAAPRAPRARSILTAILLPLSQARITLHCPALTEMARTGPRCRVRRAVRCESSTKSAPTEAETVIPRCVCGSSAPRIGPIDADNTLRAQMAFRRRSERGVEISLYSPRFERVLHRIRTECRACAL